MHRVISILIWVLIDLLVIISICVIELYLRQDKLRFVVGKVLKEYKELFDDWMKQACDLEEMPGVFQQYRDEKDVCCKLCLIEQMANQTNGKQTLQMAKRAKQLEPFFGLYERYAVKFNKLFTYPLICRLLKLLRFTPMPNFQLARHVHGED